MAIISTDSTYTFTVTGNRSLTAVFEAIAPTYTITATIDPDGSGTVTGAGQYQEGQTATLVATPSDGYKFTGWREGSETVSTDTTYSFTVTGDRTFVGVFAVASRLPDGYTEVEYIYRPGYGAYLNGKYPISTNKKYTIKIKYEGYGTTSTVYSFLAGDYRISNYARGVRIYGINTGGITFEASRDTSTGSYKSAVFTADESFDKDVELIFDLKNKTASLNGTEKPVDFTFSSFLQSPIPKIMGDNAAADVMQGRLYFYKEYENDVLVAELVPCVNPSGVVGVYDIVNDEFKSSAGSVQFTAGPAV